MGPVLDAVSEAVLAPCAAAMVVLLLEVTAAWLLLVATAPPEMKLLLAADGVALLRDEEGCAQALLVA